MIDAPASARHDAAVPDHGHRAVREALLAGAASTVILFVSVYGLWIAVQNTAREQERTEIVRLAHTLSSVVDPVLHQQLRDSAQTDSPLYLRAVDALRRARLATPGIKYAYTMVRDGEDIRFVLDAAQPGDHDGDGIEDRSTVWALYDESDPALNEALGAPGHPGTASATAGPTTDKWGSFISGYAPIFDAAHRQIGIVGVDVDAGRFLADEAARRRAALVGLFPAAFLVLGLSAGVYQVRRNQLGAQRRVLSARQQADDATALAARQERRTRSIIDGSGVVAWELDRAQGRFTYVSPQVARFGYPASDWLQPGFWRETVHPDDGASVSAFLLRGQHDGTGNRLQYRLRRSSGKDDWVELVVSPERDDDSPTTLRGVLIDITEAHRLRLAAEAASRSKSEFLANMSHEIRTPLTAILGYAELLREDGDAHSAPPHRIQTIETIRSAGQYLLAVINDILDLSKIEAGRMTVETVAVDLPALLVESVALLRPRATAKELPLSVVLDTPIPSRAITDPTRLRQVIFNLVGNAIKFTATGRVTVHVSVDHPDEAVQTLRIDVDDTGPGLSVAQSARLFQPFSQADTSVTRTHGGSGLGLVISRRLADLMGGNVTLHRSEPGNGSTFRLQIEVITTADSEMVSSLHAAGEAEATRAAAPPVRLAGRVLVAEDNPVNQRLLEVFLRKAGATIVTADNGALALQALDAATALGEPFDLLITDMQMPEMDGYTLVRTLRARGDPIPAVALTAHAMAEDRQLCLDAGCDDYATKPVDLPGLLRLCARWVDAAPRHEHGGGAPGGPAPAHAQAPHHFAPRNRMLHSCGAHSS